jgi:hypothetical protein
MTLHEAVLEVDCDVDDDGNEETGEFHMVGNVTVTEQTQMQYSVGDVGQTVNSVFQRITDNPTRRGVYIDLGEGNHIFDIQFDGWRGAKDSSNVSVTWGDPSKPSPSIANATGEDPLTQMQVFHQYLRKTVIDSLNPARLRVGEYDSSGLSGFADELYVVPQAPQMSHQAEEYSTVTGNMQLFEVERLDTVLDAKERLGI